MRGQFSLPLRMTVLPQAIGVAGYILAQRLAACRRLLADRGHAHRSLTDIALGLGFQNMAHFSRVFRAHLGVAPSDYRKATFG